MEEKIYIAIDLKSFYASVECAERGLNPLTTNLVVADLSRTEKTICLAVSPSLKAYEIPGRARLFEVVQKVKEINIEREKKAPNHIFSGESFQAIDLKNDSSLKLTYITAPPRMSHYMNYSTDIYKIYLKYFAPEDIHVYSIDEVFIDAASYLNIYKLTPKELVRMIIKEILSSTGITATAGIGTNLYLCKIAMDIVAKHTEPDENGARIAELDELSYRKLLWSHRPITDFWRVGRGTAKRLEEKGLYTMGDIARCSLGRSEEFYNEELLYKLFGVNAELLIDHAWGWEPCTIKAIKEYKPASSSLSTGQVLHCAYTYEKAKLVTEEMIDSFVLELVEKKLFSNQFVLTIGYDKDSLTNPSVVYNGPVTTDRYGRRIPKHAHGTVNLPNITSSSKLIVNEVLNLYSRIVNPNLLIRRITIAANVTNEQNTVKKPVFEQLDLLTDYEELEKQKQEDAAAALKEKKIQESIIEIKRKFGKNAIIKGMNLQDGATAISRNKQIGGHKA